MLRLKIPINITARYDYLEMFKYVVSNGFMPEPYLSSSKFSLRAGQDDVAGFKWHMEKFGSPLYSQFVNRIELVFNTHSQTDEVYREIEIALDITSGIGVPIKKLALILNKPNLVVKYHNAGFNVVVSSASLVSYKKVIEVLASKHNTTPRNKGIEYVLPSDLNHLIPILPPNSFQLLLNNGCQLNCVYAGVVSDHSMSCPIQTKLAYQLRGKTDIIRRDGLIEFIKSGWEVFKIAGRQASPIAIFDVIRYYLGCESICQNPPYIDNHLWYR